MAPSPFCGIELVDFCFFVILCPSFGLFFAVEMIESDDLIHVTNAIAMFIINVFAFVTILYFKMYEKEYAKLVNYMHENFLTRSAYGLTFMTVERSYLLANRHAFWWTIMCVGGTLQWSIVPLFVQTRMLPIDIKYPFDALISSPLIHFHSKIYLNLQTQSFFLFVSLAILHFISLHVLPTRLTRIINTSILYTLAASISSI